MTESNESLIELKLQALEQFSPFYATITHVAQGQLPLEALHSDFIRLLLHYVAADIGTYKAVKQHIKESN